MGFKNIVVAILPFWRSRGGGRGAIYIAYLYSIIALIIARSAWGQPEVKPLTETGRLKELPQVDEIGTS